MSQGKIIRNRIEFSINNHHLSNYKLVRLDEISEKIMSWPFWSSLKSESYLTEGVPFIRIKNIQNHTINEEDLVYISEIDNNKIKNSELNKWDIVLSKIWTIWEFALINFDKCNISENNIWIKLKQDNSINNKYIFYYLTSSFIKNYLNNHLSWNVQKFLNVKTIKEIEIPLPPLEIQEQIVEKMDNAIAEKERLESESEEIMNSIDDYVLSELWIQLQKEQEEKKFFTVNIEDIKNWRLDVFYNKPEFKEIEKCILNSNYEVHRLWEYINEIKYGASIKNNYSEKWIPFLRIKDIQANQINIDEMVYLDVSERKNLWNCYVHEWDFLISRSWSIWIVALVNEKFEWFAYWSFMIKFNLRDDGLNKLYVSYRLNNKVNQIIIEKEKIWAIQQNITIDTIKDFYLPLPPKEIQDKIANEVKNRIEKANELKKQANEIYEQAKNEVEKMILE